MKLRHWISWKNRKIHPSTGRWWHAGQWNWNFCVDLLVDVNISRLFRPNVIVQLGHFFGHFLEQLSAPDSFRTKRPLLIRLFTFFSTLVTSATVWLRSSVEQRPQTVPQADYFPSPPLRFWAENLFLFQQKNVRCFGHFLQTSQTLQVEMISRI